MRSLKSTSAMLLVMSVFVIASGSAQAGPLGLFGNGGNVSDDASAPSKSIDNETTLSYGDRDMFVHLPARLPPEGQRALVIVMHGGMGNAERIATMTSEKGMNLDEMADKYGFIVAYLNGTPVTKIFGASKKGWNAGLCCGQSSENNIDDVSYVTGAVDFLAKKYGVDRGRVYGMGHSNGAMMTQRIICEVGLFASGISISGALDMDNVSSCPGARGRTILEIHGAGDTSVPIEGGMGKGISDKYPKKSQEYSKKIITNSGGKYILQVYQGAQHKMDTIEAAVEQQDHMTLPEKEAAFFGLTH